MNTLTQQDYRNVLATIHQLHQLQPLETFAEQVLRLIPKVVHSEFSFYCQGTPQRFSINCPFLDATRLEQIFGQYSHELPLICNYLKTGNPDAHKISDLLSDRELSHIEGMYQQFMRPLGLMDQMVVVLPIPAKGGQSWQQQETITVGLHRNQRDFTERDRTILNLLRPHLYQAYHNAQAWHRMQQTVDTLGAIALSLEGKVQSFPESARKILSRYFHAASGQANRLPETLQRWVNHQISQYRSDDLPSCLPLHIESEQNRLSIRLLCHPHQLQCLLLLEEQKSSALSVEALELIGLTRREAEVLLAIIQGQEIGEIAIALGIRDRTVKKHLENIYTKIGGNTRVNVILTALTKLGILPANERGLSEKV